METISIKEISSFSKNMQKVEKTYYDSIPEGERVEFDVLQNKTFPNSKVLGIFKDTEFIGFFFISLLNEFCYIVYFAIEEKYRNNGYGKQALSTLCSLYNKHTKVLCVEQPEEEDDIKTRRINFYKRSGFSLANFSFEYYGAKFYSMFNGNFNQKNYINFLLKCFPSCTNFNNT